MKYELLIFDADETLFDFKKSELYAFENTLREFNIDYKEDFYKKYKKINSDIWKEFEQGLISQGKLKVERFNRFINLLNLEICPIEFSKSYMYHLSNASFIYNDSIEVLDRINNNYKLAIITNGLKEVQEKRIKQSIISRYFDIIVVSDEIKIAKPDPKIFEYTLDKVNHTNKENVLLIGDSLTSDVQGGINFGIDTCWFNQHGKINDTNIKPTYEISRLIDITKII